MGCQTGLGSNPDAATYLLGDWGTFLDLSEPQFLGLEMEIMKVTLPLRSLGASQDRRHGTHTRSLL